MNEKSFPMVSGILALLLVTLLVLSVMGNKNSVAPSSNSAPVARSVSAPTPAPAFNGVVQQTIELPEVVPMEVKIGR